MSCGDDGGSAPHDPPTITSTAPATATEDTPYRYAATSNDVPGLTWSMMVTHTCGGELDAATGEFTFTPAGPTPSPSCEFALEVCDEVARCADQATTIAITAVNDAPVISLAAATTATEDTPYTNSATGSDPDGPGQTWSLAGTHTCGGTLTVATGDFTFTPAGPTPPAACVLALQVCDGGTPDLCASLTTPIAITAVDDPPTAVDDRPAVFQDRGASGLALLANDLDTDSGPITVASITQPTNGTAAITGAGTGVSYTPPPGYCNSQAGGTPDTFTYVVSPGGSVASVAVTVTCTYAAVSVVAGDQHACAILSDTTVKCWGRNANGQLGLGGTEDRGDAPNEMGGNLSAVSLGTGRTAVALAAGAAHTCALLDNATVKCWGYNGQGQLGLGDTTVRGNAGGQMGDNLPQVSLGTGRTAVAITADDYHTCALLDDGTVKCWGSNFAGTLGLGDTANRGDAPGEMGDSLPAVSLGTGRTAIALAGGFHRSCALLDNATIKCWGYNSSGALGLGDTADRGDGPGEMGDNLPQVSLGTGRTAVAVAAGSGHVCALLDNATVKCWGSGYRGQLGLGDANDRGNDAGEMGDSLPQVSLGTGRTAIALSAGVGHTCAVLDDATLKCWGYNYRGILGLGDGMNRGDAAGEMGDSLPRVSLGTGRTVIRVAAGDQHTCVLLDDATVKCWGYNADGQLGLGDVADRGGSASQMGDTLPAVSL